MDKKSTNNSASSQARASMTKRNNSLGSERLTNSEMEQLRQAQNEAVASIQKRYPNLRLA